MKKVEIFLDDITVKKNGNPKANANAEEDLILAMEWRHPNFRREFLKAAVALPDIVDNERRDFRTEAAHDPIKNQDRLLYRTEVESDSVIAFTLIKKSGIGANLFLELLASGVGLATGGLGSFGSALAQGIVDKLFALQGDWHHKLGEARLLIEEQAIETGTITVDLTLTDDVKRDLLSVYRTRYKDFRSGAWVWQVADQVDQFIVDEAHNGTVTLGVRVR